MTEPGLRERKRLDAMRRAQAIALDLFDEHGYDAVTIEQIAAAAQLSPSSIYRYFGTKEQLVFWDEVDPVAFQRMAEGLADHPPLEAARLALRSVVVDYASEDADMAYTIRRMRYMMGEPEVRQAFWSQTEAAAELIAQLVARQLGRDADELPIQVFAHAIIGAFVAGFHHWHATGYRVPLGELIDQVFAVVEGGFDLTRDDTVSTGTTTPSRPG